MSADHSNKLPESPKREFNKRKLSPPSSSHSLFFHNFSIPLPATESYDYTVVELLPYGYGFAVNFFQKFNCKHLTIVKTFTFKCMPQFDVVLREIITPKKGLLIQQDDNIYFGVPKFCDDTQHTISIECIITTKELLDELLGNFFLLYNKLFFVDVDRTVILSDYDYYNDLKIKRGPSYTESELTNLHSLFKPTFTVSGHLVFMKYHQPFTHMIECDANTRDFLIGLIQFGLCIFVTAGDIAYGEAIIGKLLEHCRLTHLSHMFGVISVRHPVKPTQKSPVDYFPENLMKRYNVTSVHIDDSPQVWFDINQKVKIFIPCIPVDPYAPLGFSGRRMHNEKCVNTTHNPERLSNVLKLVDTMFRSSGKVPSVVEPTFDNIASKVQTLIFGTKDIAVNNKLPRTESYGKNLDEIDTKACLDMEVLPFYYD